MAHEDTLADLDYNPNKLNTVATCGYDSAIRFWDLRKTDKCLLELADEVGGGKTFEALTIIAKGLLDVAHLFFAADRLVCST